MPSSPAMRYSPGREPRAGKHKRGRSLEGMVPFREKDDDLALFNEVQTKEKGNFLLQSNDDFDDLFSSKLKYFSDHKLGISIPSHGESSNLLNAEEEKNDYDWLLTPPDTPLFTSLDDETPPVNLPLRGRPRSQPISFSRSSTMERSHQSSRGSASPNRLSPSPRSGTFQSRGRSSSLPGTSPPPSLRNATTTRSSPPPSKPSTPAPRSSTPSPGRTSTASSEAIVPSYVTKPGRRNSASPKIKAWQANIPGFSSEVPPNLRTSLGDHRASYVRGSSPASSRNGSKSSRQSMSPTPSRSVSSWQSHEVDNKPKSNIKGSVASSGDDDVDSLMSITVNSFDHIVPKSSHTSSNSRNLNSSKKRTVIAASSSAPKRSIDTAVRQMDHRKSPHNMFRPLLSSVPSSNSYGSKSGALHRAVASTNPSVTTSSNTSSDMGLSNEHDTEGADPNQLAYPDMQEEVFSFEYDQFRVGTPHKPYNEIETQFIADETREGYGMETEISAASELLVEKGDIFTDNTETLCSKCGSRFRATEMIEGEPNLYLCEGCKKPEDGVDPPGFTAESVDHKSEVPETIELTVISYNKDDVSYSEPHEHSTKEGEKQILDSYTVDEENNSKISLNFESYSNPRPDISEGVGIPLLLRSSSYKSSIVRGRQFTASSITIDDFSYMRDSVTSTRSSLGHGGASASSSIDLGTSKQSETCVLGQLSSTKSDNENHKSEVFVKHERSVSSSLETICHEENSEGNVGPTCVIEQQEFALSVEAHEGDDSIDIEESNGNRRIVSDFSTSSMDTRVNDASVKPVSNIHDPDSHDDSSMNAVNQNASSSTNQEVDVAEAPNLTSLVVISEIEIEKDDVDSPDSVFDVGSHKSKNSIDDLQEPSPAPSPCSDVLAYDDNSIPQNHAQTSIEGSHTRTFTLEDATDAILFCRSIIHNLAYEAANIAIEKDNNAPLEFLQPVIRKSSPNRTDSRSRTSVTRRSSKSQNNPKQKRDPTDTNPTTFTAQDEKRVDISSTRIVGANKIESTKPPKLESKCNCVIM